MKVFVPAWWAPHAHLQTLSGHFFRPYRKVNLKRYRLNTPDHDFITYDYLEGEKEAPLVILLHGLEGSSQARYIKSILSHIAELKWHAVALNHRGCGGEMNLSATTYHSGKTDDLRFILKSFARENFSKIFAIGYSIGGNILLKYLGETNRDKECGIDKAVCVSVPYDLKASVLQLEKSRLNKLLYARSMLESLKEKVAVKFRDSSYDLNFNRIQSCTTFSVFDEEVTAKVNGFLSAEDYWQKSSSMNYLEGVSRPVLLIHADDDPFLPRKYIPLSIIDKNPKLSLILTQGGGHLGFVMGKSPFNQEKWLENTILKYLGQ